MIRSVSNTLRISTIRMDMLHEPIFDLVEKENDLDVKILTSTGKPSGARQKMKRAVMEEMVIRTKGGVKEHDLVHTRMIIADEDAVLVSSADLTRDQMHDEFNAGMYTTDKDTVLEAIAFFDNLWDEAENRE